MTVTSTVSPVLRTCRWFALFAGFGYGGLRYDQLKWVRMGEREREIGKSLTIKLDRFLMELI